MQKYKNRDGVIVQAELVTESEHQGLWHAVDANNVEGHVSDEQFKRNFTLIEDAPKTRGSKANT